MEKTQCGGKDVPLISSFVRIILLLIVESIYNNIQNWIHHTHYIASL